MPRMSLEEFLHPISPSAFLGEIFSHKPIYIEGRRGRFSHLLSWDSLNNILQSRQLQPPRIFLSKKRLLPAEEFTQASRRHKISTLSGTPELKLQCFENLLHEGWMLIINDIDEMQQPIRQICTMLEHELGDQVTANMYAGWHGTQGFETHWDDHEVIIAQVSGSKRWRIFEPDRKYPVSADRALGHKPPNQKPIWEGELNSGDLLHIPRGWWHDAIPVGNEGTLHLTFTIPRQCGLDLTRQLIDLLREHECARIDLPRFGEGKDKEVFLSRFRAAVEACLPKLSIDSFLHKTDASAPSRVRPSFPWTAMRGSEHVPTSAWLHWLPPRKVRIEDRGEQVSISALASTFEFDASSGSVLRDLAETLHICVADLHQRHPETTPDELERLTLDLVSKGLVTISAAEEI